MTLREQGNTLRTATLEGLSSLNANPNLNFSKQGQGLTNKKLQKTKRDFQNVIYNSEFLNENKEAKLPSVKHKIRGKSRLSEGKEMFEI